MSQRHARRRLVPYVMAAVLSLGVGSPVLAQAEEEAFAALSAGEYDAAIRQLQRLAATRDATVRAHQGLVRALSEVGRYEEAERAARAGSRRKAPRSRIPSGRCWCFAVGTTKRRRASVKQWGPAPTIRSARASTWRSFSFGRGVETRPWPPSTALSTSTTRRLASRRQSSRRWASPFATSGSRTQTCYRTRSGHSTKLWPRIQAIRSRAFGRVSSSWTRTEAPTRENPSSWF